MYQCSKKLVKYKEYRCFDHSDFPVYSLCTFDACWGGLGTSIFGNSSSAANNTRSRPSSRRSFRLIKIRCFPVFPFAFLARHYWTYASQKSNKQKTPRNHIFCHQDSPTHLFLYLILKHVFFDKSIHGGWRYWKSSLCAY